MSPCVPSRVYRPLPGDAVIAVPAVQDVHAAAGICAHDTHERNGSPRTELEEDACPGGHWRRALVTAVEARGQRCGGSGFAAGG